MTDTGETTGQDLSFQEWFFTCLPQSLGGVGIRNSKKFQSPEDSVSSTMETILNAEHFSKIEISIGDCSISNRAIKMYQEQFLVLSNECHFGFS